MARGGDRTPEERERARLERAAKRAAREGRPPPTELPSMEVPPPTPGEQSPGVAPARDRIDKAPPPAAEPPPAAAKPPAAAAEPPPTFEQDEFLAEPPPAAPVAEPPPAPESSSPKPSAAPLPETADLPAVEPEPEPELFYDPLEADPQAAPPEPLVPPEPPEHVAPQPPLETGEHLVEDEPLETGEHPVGEGEFETGEHLVGEEPLETGEHPVGEGEFETGEHLVEEEPFETGEHLVGDEPFETGEHPIEEEPFETGEHPIEEEPFETGEHDAEQGPHPGEVPPQPRPLAALPAYPPQAADVGAATVVSPGAAQRRSRARELLDRRRAAGGAAPPRKPRSRARYLVLGVLAVIVVGAAWVANSLFQPLKGDGSGRAAVQIPTGASVGQIGDLLEERGVISNAFFFEVRATLAGRRDDFKAGRFTLASGMSNTAAMDAISQGPPADVTQVVIPEGRARTQVRDLIGDRLRGNYLTLTRSNPELDPRRYGAPRSVNNLEGFLFPDTYELKRGATTRTLVRTQLAQFKREFAKVDLAAAKRRKLTAYDVLTIASMIDQEAQVPRERRLVASVITNRLREGIPLGIDATTRYATNNRTRPLTRSELESNSPYNTRNRRGLPPGPIGSPGLAAIRAAANPARTDFLFYVVKPCGNGSHAFSRTNAEFERDVERYNAERTRRGGRSPTDC